MKRRTGTFTARGEDNRNYTIYEYTDFIDVGSLGDNSNQPVVGSKELRTSDGMAVIQIEHGVYKIVVTDLILHSDLQAAP